MAPGQDLTEAAMATFLYDKLVAEKAKPDTYKDAHKTKVDAGLVTLKRSVALVPACHSRVPVASGSYLLL